MRVTQREIHYLGDDIVALQTEYKKEPYYILIDKDDLPKVENKSIYLRFKGDKTPTPYPMVALGKRGLVQYLHLYLANEKPQKGYVIDHKFGDTLDNRKEMLRVCTIGQNTKNCKNNTNKKSKYKGVFWYKNRWRVQIMSDRKSIHIGSYGDEIEAAKAYKFARLNVIEQ